MQKSNIGKIEHFQTNEERGEYSMTKKKRTEKIIEIVFSVLSIIMVQMVFTIILALTPLANYIGVRYENQYYNKNIYAEGKVSSYILEETQKALDNIPESLVSLFYENGGMVNVKDEKSESTYTYDNKKIKFHVAGYYLYANDKNYSINIMTNIFNIKFGTIEHEFGHYLDSLFGFISNKELFKNAYLQEYQYFKKHIESDNYYDDTKEYFAESFSIYLLKPKKLEKYCPQTYNIIDMLVDSVEV